KWPAEWLGSLKVDLNDNPGKPMSIVKAWVPYVMLAVILVASRVSPELKGFVQSVSLSFSNILGETGVSAAIQPLYLPG
ncbi:L-lactate permease, partial [Vibrio parahaemolyticus]|nr:L-lactate permease [Vibrio parahaemolyticus]